MPFEWSEKIHQWVVMKLPPEYGGDDYTKQPLGVDLPPEIYPNCPVGARSSVAPEKDPEPTYPVGQRPALKRYQIVMSDGFDGSLGVLNRPHINPYDTPDYINNEELHQMGFSISRDPFAEAVRRSGDKHRGSYYTIHSMLAGRKGMWHRWNKASNEYSVVLYTEAALAYFHHRVRRFIERDGSVVVAAKMKEWDTPWQGEMPEYHGDECMPSQHQPDVPLDEWVAQLPPEKAELWKRLNA